MKAIETAVCEGNKLFITEKLDRKQYIEVDKFLQSVGGIWNKKEKAHVFPGDAQTALDSIPGKLPKKNPLNFFETPESLARLLVELADIAPSSLVLEPSAGKGAIVDILLEETNNVYAVEIDKDRFDILSKLPCTAMHVDFLTMPDKKTFDYVVMNPPFNSDDRKDCYIEHIHKAYDMLRPGGRLVSVVPKGIEFRNDKRVKGFREFVLENGEIRTVPDRVFSDTAVLVSVVVLEAPQ